ncbi:Uncharacterized protein OBRU01_12652 [Operophtera brumata]|uniref:Uncharacterized protein n=1 Tax=Operophtera brumata TaxID=104452 RepID=A0A0L7L320_OPEBR|nr:Uncharacterized protein OBRU01_12652 [Operophtera brumata]
MYLHVQSEITATKKRDKPRGQGKHPFNANYSRLVLLLPEGGYVQGAAGFTMIDGRDVLKLEVCTDNSVYPSAEVLVPLIQSPNEEGSEIHTDVLQAYDCLLENGFLHKEK